MAKHIHQGLVYGTYHAVCYWSIGEREGGLDMDSTKSAAKSGKFAAAKHFFRFVRPGAVRIDVSPELPTVALSAYVHNRDGTLTVVLVNTGTSP